MDSETLERDLKYINLNGITLNLEERMQLKLSFE
jgi:hypothetical protein